MPERGSVRAATAQALQHSPGACHHGYAWQHSQNLCQHSKVKYTAVSHTRNSVSSTSPSTGYQKLVTSKKHPRKFVGGSPPRPRASAAVVAGAQWMKGVLYFRRHFKVVRQNRDSFAHADGATLASGWSTTPPKNSAPQHERIELDDYARRMASAARGRVGLPPPGLAPWEIAKLTTTTVAVRPWRRRTAFPS